MIDFNYARFKIEENLRSLNWGKIFQENNWNFDGILSFIKKEYIWIKEELSSNCYEFYFWSLLFYSKYSENENYLIFGKGIFDYLDNHNIYIHESSIKIYSEILIPNESFVELNSKYVNSKKLNNCSSPIPIFEGSNEFIHLYKNKKINDNEIFYPCRNFYDYTFDNNKQLEVSNYGRLKEKNEIITQYFDPDPKESVLKDNKYGLKIHRLVASTFLPVYTIDSKNYYYADDPFFGFIYRTVHHKNNNGYDSRIENLIWVTTGLHNWIQYGKIF